MDEDNNGIHLVFIFSNKASSGGIYYSNAIYLPKNLTLTLSNVEFLGSSGNFASQIEVEHNDTYVYLTATNTAFAGLTASCVGTVA